MAEPAHWSLSSHAAPAEGCRKVVQERVLNEMLGSIQDPTGGGWKALVLDSTTTRILSSAMRMSDILEAGDAAQGTPSSSRAASLAPQQGFESLLASACSSHADGAPCTARWLSARHQQQQRCLVGMQGTPTAAGSTSSAFDANMHAGVGFAQQPIVHGGHSCACAPLAPAGVSVVEDIEKRREPLPLAAVYFISPSPSSVAHLVADFESKPLYPSVHVFFSSGVTQDVVDRIKRCRVGSSGGLDESGVPD